MSSTKSSTIAAKFATVSAKKSGRVHVVPNMGKWIVKKEGAIRATAIKKDKKEAEKVANNLKYVKRVIVHKKDGTIQKNTGKK